mmetsp:Transcript_57519/g.106229  ORF Transcript_57519/g.106229 Transcript_57519/m.106229 type:complete len:217 (-) Transcript_57519:655-1305(-)
MTLSNCRKWSDSILEYNLPTSACLFKKRPWISQMCQPQIRTGCGKHGLKHINMATQFVKIPRKKPVAGKKIARPTGLRWLNAMSCTTPNTNPIEAPQCSIKRNSLSPNWRKKLLSNSLFSTNTVTTMLSLSIPTSGSHNISVICCHSDGLEALICSIALSMICFLTAVGTKSHVCGKCLVATVARVRAKMRNKFALVRVTRTLGSTLPSQDRGPSR